MESANLVDGVMAAAVLITAVFATIAAYFSWVQARQYVVVEAFETIRSDFQGTLELTLAVAVCNRRRTSIQPLTLEVRGLPKADVSCLQGEAKEPGRDLNLGPFPNMPIPPFESREVVFNIAFDWQAARALAPAGGGDLRWQAIVVFSDRHRRGKRWTHELNLAFQGAELHRLTSGPSTAVERRRPGRPFSGVGAADQRSGGAISG